MHSNQIYDTIAQSSFGAEINKKVTKIDVGVISPIQGTAAPGDGPKH